ncbi:MAG: YggT family protein [Clostridia bacterium]
MGVLYLTINALIRVIELLFIGRIIISFVVMFTGKSNRFFDIIISLTEPILTPIRNFLFKSEVLRSLPIDFSPLVVFFVIGILRRIIFILL